MILAAESAIEVCDDEKGATEARRQCFQTTVVRGVAEYPQWKNEDEVDEPYLA